MCLRLAVSPSMIYTGHQSLFDGVNLTFGHAKCQATAHSQAEPRQTWDDRRERRRSGSRNADGHFSATVAIGRSRLLAVCSCVSSRATQVFISANSLRV